MSRLRSESGMVLLVVLLVIALLATLLTEFSFSTLVDLRLAETFRDSTRGYYLARGGITVGRMFLNQNTNEYDAPDELWAQGLPNFPVGGGYVSISAEDLSAKINLNQLVDSQGNVDSVLHQRLLILFGLVDAPDPDLLADSLIDWLDPDDQEEPKGAESNYYLSRATPYPAGNGPLASFDELALVRGFDATLLKSLAPHVTVYSTADLSPGQVAFNARKINVNTASKEVLTAVLTGSDRNLLGPAEYAADQILQLREQGPIKSLTAVRALPGLSGTGQAGLDTTDLDVKSRAFRITSEGDVNDGRRTVTAVVTASNRLLEQKVD